MAMQERSSATGVRWDLSGVFADGAAARGALAGLAERAERLATHALEADELDAPGIRSLLDEASELAALRDALDESHGYAGLRLHADLDDDEALDLVAEGEAPLARARDALRIVASAVGKRPDLAADPALGPYRHWVEHQAALADTRLAPAAETAFAARGHSAATAWGRLAQDVLTAASVPFDDGAGKRQAGVVELRLLRHHGERRVRRLATEALEAAYRANAVVVAACLDAAIADRLAEDRLRSRDDAMAATLAIDEVERDTVEAVLTATEDHVHLLERWYERKRVALGVPQVEACDRFGPVGGDPPRITWDEAVDVCVTVFEELAPGLGGEVRAVVDARGVDAEQRRGKSGGIFCSPLPVGYGTYVFLTYLDSAKGVTDLAHELGHAVHYEVAKRALPWLVAVEPASAAFFEVPSTLSEILVAEHLGARAGGSEGKALLRGALEPLLSLLFEAAVLTRFEQDACRARADGVALTPAHIEQLWTARDRVVSGPLTEPLGVMGWPHPFQARFYGYQYTYATLAALCLSVIRREDPLGFSRDYVAMLEETGTGTPAELLARCGLDVRDPGVWRRGFDELARLCELAW